MSEARIDRLLAAAVHQAIADLLPNRLDFYESYLRPRAWREDAVNLAPVAAVLSFLRHEEAGTYEAVMNQSARYAARWIYDALPWRLRVLGRLAPTWVRLRRLSEVLRRNLHRSYRGTRVRTSVRRGTVSVTVQGSIFCASGAVADAPRCRYYVALVEELLRLDGFAIDGSEVVGCCACQAKACTFRVATGGRAAMQTAPASLGSYDVS